MNHSSAYADMCVESLIICDQAKLDQYTFIRDFPPGSDGKESAYNAGDPGSIPGLGRSPGEGNGYPLHLAWRLHGQMQRSLADTAHGVGKSRT